MTSPSPSRWSFRPSSWASSCSGAQSGVSDGMATGGNTSARWRRLRTAEAIASVHASAACYRGPEDVRVLPVVMTELKFREIERQVLGGDVVVRPDNPALEQRPEGIEVLRVDFAANVLARSMAHGLMRE